MSTPGVLAALLGAVFVVLLLVWVVPPVLLRVVVRAYPPGHARRAELVHELAAVPVCTQPVWVVALIPLCLREGISERDRALHDRRRRPVRDVLLGKAAAFAAVVVVVAAVAAVGLQQASIAEAQAAQYRTAYVASGLIADNAAARVEAADPDAGGAVDIAARIAAADAAGAAAAEDAAANAHTHDRRRSCCPRTPCGGVDRPSRPAERRPATTNQRLELT